MIRRGTAAAAVLAAAAALVAGCRTAPAAERSAPGAERSAAPVTAPSTVWSADGRLADVESTLDRISRDVHSDAGR